MATVVSVVHRKFRRRINAVVGSVAHDGTVAVGCTRFFRALPSRHSEYAQRTQNLWVSLPSGNAPAAALQFPTMSNDCLFCRIIKGEIPAKKVYEDDRTFAFEDINPQAPTHVLIIPKKHIVGLKEATAEDAELLGYCQLVAAKIGRERGIESSYRTVYNVGPGAGQSVFHIHLHLVGGRDLKWPPG